ncbi:MAG TPA: HD domain-containing phosphohydrolase [Pyrinomonadaceae bacterium]|jgi:putative two-component system response regulator
MFRTNNTKARLLIVDDEPEVRDLLCTLLGEAYSCCSTSSAEGALTLLHAEEFDLVLSDIQMDGMCGLELVSRLRALAPDTLIILISGMHTIESPIKALRAGAYDYIMKPFDLAQVEASVARALDHRALLMSKYLYENHLEKLVQQRTRELEAALSSQEVAYRSTLKALGAALETRDHETHGHSERVIDFSLRLGLELGLDREQLRALEFGALLHDIGKIGVPDAILRKPAKLTDREWTEMRRHPLHGQSILHGIEFLEGAARVVAQHHEQWDGSGYPLGLCGEEIDFNARIFSVADAFDAMTSDRVYRAARSYEAAALELDQYAGRQFDPRVVAAFHCVPREEWAEMRRRSTSVKEECAEKLGAFAGALFNGQVTGFHPLESR